MSKISELKIRFTQTNSQKNQNVFLLFLYRIKTSNFFPLLSQLQLDKKQYNFIYKKNTIRIYFYKTIFRM